jgi:hypothetical protein
MKFQGEERERHDGQVLVRVFSDTRHTAQCRKCKAPVTWAQVCRTSKWVLFNFPVPVMMQTIDRATSRPCEYLRHDDVHWNTCTAD